jgi:cysteine-rich repeat protein
MIVRRKLRLFHLLTVALAVATVATFTACGDNEDCIGDECDVVHTEQCNIPGDEDGDGAADCADSDCATDTVCSRCGDGVQNIGEGCDDGNQVDDDECTNACQRARCGDGITGPGEQCDDANTVNTDACTNACQDARCGDGITFPPGEACDDGNQNDTDGCSNPCQIMRCGDGVMNPGEACDDGNMINTDGCTNACALPTCGDGFMQAGEQCDDGNMNNGDACLNTCMTARCGDSVVRTGVETCDDADNDDGDGCSANCSVETGYACSMEPSQCATVCGDGIIVGSETCDQGGMNVADGDGCSATCAIEMGYICFGTPSICLDSCGNGTVEAGEQCDDANLVFGDGCNSFCQFDIGCGAGETQVAASNATSTPIPDVASGSTSVMITSNQIVSKVVAYVDISHNWDTDVDISLTGPRMITRDLSSDNGNSDDNYTRTFFDDTAATSILTATAPFTGRFRPEQSLGIGGFRGQLAGGPWTLTATDDAAGIAGNLNHWSLIMCTSLQVPVCGNGNIDAGEECDDGNTVDNDACNNACGVTMGCGNGVIDAGEECDDDNTASGDGCSATCALDIACPAGQTAVVVANNTALPIPDNDPSASVTSTVTIPTIGGVTRAQVYITSLTHPWSGDVNMFLRSPGGRERELTTGNGSSGDDYTGTMFDDLAGSTITSGSAPFTGVFRPEQSMALTSGIDMRQLNANGTWGLRIFDNGNGDLGTLNGWKLLMCVNPASYCGDSVLDAGEECDDGNNVGTDACNNLCAIVEGCGDGNLDPGESCDDDNIVSGDGCSATCAPELTCPAGQTPVIVTNNTAAAIPDNDQVTGVASDVTVATTGAVVSAKVYLGTITHTNDADLDIYLRSPNGVQRELSTDNGSTNDNYVNTTFDDTATTTISSGTAPFNGRFKPELSLSTTVGTDFNRLRAQGTWTLRVFDDLATNTGSLQSWTLLACVNPTATYCGDTMINGAEECDDGNSVDNDLCNNQCRLVDGCGDGNLDVGELCDDDNIVSGDGCSSACMPEGTCAAGLTPVIVSNPVPVPIPDNDQVVGASSSVVVPTTGAIVSAKVYIASITHANTGHLDIYLESSTGFRRELSTDNGSGANYFNTLLDDTATTTISSGSSPFNGRFKPELSLSTTAGTDMNRLRANGTWTLRVFDDSSGTVGTLNSWSLIACVDPAAASCGDGTRNGNEECDDGNSSNADACNGQCQLIEGCGDGNLDPGESCDDDNIASGDGCSATCVPEVSCAAGLTPVVVTNSTAMPIPDNDQVTGVSSAVTVATTGSIVSARVYIASLTHTNDADLDMYLVAPNTVRRELSTDNGSTGDNYYNTTIDDTATTAISSGSAPFNGHYKPEASLTGTINTDFSRYRADGTWTLRVFDDLANNTGTLQSWTLLACVDPAGSTCGDGMANGGEECDDGNTNDADNCTSFCSIVDGCGDGNLDPGEICDDNNVASGDGCSATCQPDISCAAGEMAVLVSNANALPLIDANNAGATSSIVINQAGLVRKAYVTVNVTHPVDADVDMWLMSPWGAQRELSTERSGVNYRGTIFTDAATNAITSGTAPFTGQFKPIQTLGAFTDQTAAGEWLLRVADDTSTGSGQLDNWTLHLCVDPALTKLCGNGAVEAGESCDDNNTMSGDGCSDMCQMELSCTAGETAVIVTSMDAKLLPQDNVGAGVTSFIPVAAAGNVTKAVVGIGNLGHTFDGDLDMTLIAPNATTVDISSDNGSLGEDYLGTVLADAATALIGTATAPMRGYYKPDAPLLPVAGQPATGMWGLKVVDDATGDTGILRHWTIGLCVAP